MKINEVIKQVLCGVRSPLGAIMEFVVGSAAECWCCSAWRGFFFGAAAGFLGGLGAGLWL